MVECEKVQNEETPYPLVSTAAYMGIMDMYLHTHIGSHMHVMHAHTQIKVLME